MGRNRRKEKKRDRGQERVLVRAALLAAATRVASSLITMLFAWWNGQ